MRLFWTTIALLCMTTITSSSAYAGYNLITNGSFEEPGSGGYDQGREIGNPGGWYVEMVTQDGEGYSVDIDTSTAADGSKSIDLEGSWPASLMGQPYVLSGTISQELSTTAGNAHIVSFMMSGNYAPGESHSVTKWLQILWNDEPLQEYSFNAAESGEDAWVYHQITIPARFAMESDKISFKSLNITAAGTGYGAMVDDVQMYAVVPEPSTLTCLLAIPAMLLIARRRKRLDR